ncbi:MAG TPA: RNA-binding protein [bacterium]|nr:RNA-binding protein [bacterium]HPP86548.1 RNA-binding protein [bacterium]
MNSKLYVGNLNWQVTDDQLQSLFSQYGEVVSAKVITDRSTSKSRGFAFVEFANEEASEKAISELNGKEWEGRMLKINKARPQQERSNRGDRSKFRRKY